MTEECPAAPPPGEYAIVEILGHRTIVGRFEEVERFGTKMLAIEPLFDGRLLPAIFVGGGSIYQCTPEIALKQAPRHDYQLPASITAAIEEARP